MIELTIDFAEVDIDDGVPVSEAYGDEKYIAANVADFQKLLQQQRARNCGHTAVTARTEVDRIIDCIIEDRKID